MSGAESSRVILHLARGQLAKPREKSGFGLP